jgi:hypothetical protein
MEMVFLHQVRVGPEIAYFIRRCDTFGFINSLPIGAISAVVTMFVVKIPDDAKKSQQSLWTRIKQLDLIGSAILIAAVVCILLAMQWGGSAYHWYNPRIVGLMGGFTCLSVIFILTQIRLGERATLPPRLITQRTVAASLCFMFLFSACYFVLTFFLPLYFQSVNGVSATKSGIRILPLLLATVLSSVVSGGLITAAGYYTPFLLGGAVLFCIGAGLLSTCTVSTHFAKLLGYQILIGIGGGFAFQIPIVAVQAVLPLGDVAIGTACVMFFQALGGALSVSIGQTVFKNGLIRGTRKFAPQVDPYALLMAGATEIRSVLARLGLVDQLPGTLQAYMVGLTDCFRVVIVFAVAAVVTACFFEWRSVKVEEVKRSPARQDRQAWMDLCDNCQSLYVIDIKRDDIP